MGKYKKSSEVSVEELQHKMNAIPFKGFDGLSLGEGFYFELKYCMGRRNVFGEIKNMLKELSTVTVEIKKKGGKYLLFAEKENARKDHYAWLKKVYDTLDDATLFVMWNKSDGKKHLGNLKYLYLLPIWFFQISRIKELSFKRRIHYVCWLLAQYPYYKLIKSYIEEMNDLKCLITHCDVHFCSALVTQLQNLRGVKTVTIAHSNFMGEDAFVYYKSKSDYMILHSQLMLRNANRYNNKRKYVVLGDPRSIGTNFDKVVKKTNYGILGVLLSCGLNSKENQIILESAKYCAEKLNYKLKIKKHPIDENQELSIDFASVETIFISSLYVSLSEFIKDCDAIITGGSNVFFECVTQLKLTFLADIENPYFSSFQWCKFSDGNQLKRLIEKYLNNDYDYTSEILDLREELAVTTNVEMLYKNFLTSII